MTKIKTAELIDEKLNWAVVKASGQNAEYWLEKYASEDRRCMCEAPSTDWSKGGPIIEREHISIIDCDGYDFWRADKMNAQAQVVTAYGSTPLIAAMRCYIASKLGDEIEIPNELVTE